jgi:predicted nucleotidyltransferase component of viral defense system
VKKTSPKDVGASVRARLLRLAHERGEDFQLVLMRYANERLLYRLTISRHGERFVLKGAALFTLWTGKPHRATRDVDLLGFGDPAEAHIRKVFAEILALDVEDDGVRFDLSSLEVGPIREEQEYGGVRVEVVARITSAQVRLQVDIGFSDAITPDAAVVEFPPLLEFPAPRIRAYPRESVIAEKLEAMVKLGIANGRMKDFYDIVVLARSFDFDGEVLVRALRATFDRRKTPLPEGLPVALTPAFADDAC